MKAKVFRSVLVVVAAVALGPFVAAVALWLLKLGITSGDQSEWVPSFSVAMLRSLMSIPLFLIESYYIGTRVAFMAGLIVAIWMIWRPPSLLVVLGASISGAFIYLSFSGWNSKMDLLATPVCAAIAGSGCWFLLQRYAEPA